MRLVVQRVDSASVAVGDREVSRIGRGAVVLVGVGEDDESPDAEWCVDRIAKTALWEDAEGRPWHHSVESAGLDVLLVSQFTLLATLKKKRGGLSWHRAMGPEAARDFYAAFVQSVRARLPNNAVRDGEFGAKMRVALVNDGPVTLALDSRTGNGLPAVAPPPPPSVRRDGEAANTASASASAAAPPW